MRAFIVELENRPGSMADVCEAIGAEGINVVGVAGMTWDAEGAVGLITNNDSATRRLLEEREAKYREVELVAAGLEDRPGALADAARRLADRGVNIEAAMTTSMLGSKVTIAFGVDDAIAAREALGELANLSGASI
ncbi:MAG TPA: ACT domain-containing protein [Candidatus Limnocylindrales bacterium]|jgi:hypothetical protein|nr:ACT domain-containing protein [Candidatus Limnocylindrales bacterium]